LEEAEQTVVASVMAATAGALLCWPAAGWVAAAKAMALQGGANTEASAVVVVMRVVVALVVAVMGEVATVVLGMGVTVEVATVVLGMGVTVEVATVMGEAATVVLVMGVTVEVATVMEVVEVMRVEAVAMVVEAMAVKMAVWVGDEATDCWAKEVKVEATVRHGPGHSNVASVRRPETPRG